MERLFGLHFRIEIYTPKTERNHGYYAMPILHRNRIVGIADPKVDRERHIMKLHALNLLPGVEVDDDLLTGLSSAIKELAAFTACSKIEITETTPITLKRKLEV